MRIRHILAIVLAAFGLTSCDDSTPTQPTGPSVSGRWEGGYQITACVAAGSCAPSPCRFILGQRSTLRLTLQQTAAQAYGALELYLDDPFFIRTGEVSGAVDSSGSLGLSGSIPQVDRESGLVGRYFDVTWATTLDSGGSSMSGGFSFTTRNASGSACTTSETATITSLARIP